ncbi:MAG: twin-arginine translocase subunit TatC, partial [Armatimonadetes bacterium]|nr:twin-arginine translocase subunit TatC [Anaerolineae bacterium]
MAQQTKLPIKVPPTPIPPPTPDENDANVLRMSLLDHLLELRNRLARAGLAVGIGTVLGFLITEPVFYFLLNPYRLAYPEGGARLTTLAPTDSIISYLRVSLLVGAILAIPVITYQLMMFIVPGLTQRERRTILTALPAVTLLFL